jgi:peroxiredoxin
MTTLTRRTTRGPTPLALAMGASLVGATLVAPVRARAERVEGLGAPAAQAVEILRSHPLRRLDGGTMSLGELRGQVVVVTFWASWCPPCRREMPRMNALNAEISSRGGLVVAISIDEDRVNVERFVRRHGLALPVVHDGPDGLARALDLRAVPLALVIDRRGTLVYSSSRSDDAALAQLEATTRELLGARSVAVDSHAGDPQ